MLRTTTRTTMRTTTTTMITAMTAELIQKITLFPTVNSVDFKIRAMSPTANRGQVSNHLTGPDEGVKRVVRGKRAHPDSKKYVADPVCG
jgi:hypothetical protein